MSFKIEKHSISIHLTVTNNEIHDNDGITKTLINVKNSLHLRLKLNRLVFSNFRWRFEMQIRKYDREGKGGQLFPQLYYVFF